MLVTDPGGNNLPVDDGDGVSIYLNNDGDGHGSPSTNSQMAVFETNQTPNTFIGAPDSNTTNGQKDFINELEGGANAIVNESPIVKQQYVQIERQVNNNLQVQQGNHSDAIPQAANPAFGAASEDYEGVLGPWLTLEDRKLCREYSADEVNELFNIDEPMSRFLSHQEMPVFETNQAPNTPIGAPDFTSEGDLKRTE